jgi:hypothetical protein
VSLQTPPQRKRIVIPTTAVLDGSGRVLRNTRTVVEGAKIVALHPERRPVDYDVRALTIWLFSERRLTLLDELQDRLVERRRVLR